MTARRQQPLGPSYDEELYWDEKFKAAQEPFEWLGSGKVLLDCFHQVYPGHASVTSSFLPPRILQLGAGSSSLSCDLARNRIIDSGTQAVKILSSILNVDFSQEALNIGEKQAKEQGLNGMQFIRVDLRSWKDLSSCRPLIESPLDFIFDKSTSDAISTNFDVAIGSLNDKDLCPLLSSSVTEADINAASTILDPLDLVALHLAALSKSGCLWAVLSYSCSRFDIFNNSACQSRHYWSIVQQAPIQAPNGSKNPSAPPVYHWFYLLQRS